MRRFPLCAAADTIPAVSTSNLSERAPSARSVWIAAARPRTLALAFASMGMGTFLAAAAGPIRALLVVLMFLTATLLQILSNLANDYGDSIHGADSPARAGPARAVQSGRISAAAMRRAIIIVALLAMLSGLLLVWISFGAAAMPFVLLFLLIGALAVGAAVTYTAGRKPYGYAGLGDIAVFIFFGWVAVAGSYFLYTQAVDWLVLMPATSCGLFAVGVLNVNNIRDIHSDRLGGKQSIPVRLGPERARLYHWFLLIGGLAAAVFYVALTAGSPWRWLFLLSAPLFIRNGLVVQRSQNPADLDPMLKQLSLTTLLFVLLFGVGQLL